MDSRENFRGPHHDVKTITILVVSVTVLTAICFVYTSYKFFSLDDGDEHCAERESLLNILQCEVLVLFMCLMADHGLQKNNRILLVPFTIFIMLILVIMSSAMMNYSFLIIFGALANEEVNTISKSDSAAKELKGPTVPRNLVVISVLWLTYTVIKMSCSLLNQFSSLYRNMGQELPI